MVYNSVPASARAAVLVAAVIGLALPVLERRLGSRSRWLPSGSSLRLAFVIPASTSMTLSTGALIAAGLIAGESLFGVVLAIAGAAGGL